MDGHTVETITRIQVVPSDRLWFDPRVIVANCDLQTDLSTFASAAPQRIATSDPARVAIGFVSLGGGILVAPWPDVQAFPVKQLSQNDLLWYYLHVHLSIVCLDWWAVGLIGQTVRVITVRRN